MQSVPLNVRALLLRSLSRHRILHARIYSECLSNNQHRTWGISHDLVSRRAEEQASEGPVPTGSHHDEIGIHFARYAKDRSPGLARLDTLTYLAETTAGNGYSMEPFHGVVDQGAPERRKLWNRPIDLGASFAEQPFHHV